jgi:NAD-dependent dihydropyrimidine dehydrogenase PreA subunit
VITYYGYSDGSGEYYIVVDSDKCSGCGKCLEKCPQKALQLETQFIDLEDKTVVAIKEEHRKKIKYTCAACKPEINQAPCVLACKSEAVKCSWNPK